MAEEKPQPKSKLARPGIAETCGRARNELEILKFWQERRIFEKSLEKNKDSGKEFVFYEGPPTANGKPGIHHLVARAFKDAIPRYKTMQGFNVRRKGGWDTHGLPVELAVEKELGLKSKKEIEVYGIEAFNKKCKESVWTYVKEWEEFTERTGYWVDLKRPFVTYKPYYIESVWNIVSKINERGLLYKDYKVVPWCPRCGTGLSSHELAQGYEDVKDLSVTVKFEIRNPKSETHSKFKIPNEGKTYLLAWTTTPWTLPGNMGLAVNSEVEYSLWEVTQYSRKNFKNETVISKEKYILASERALKIFNLEDFKPIVVGKSGPNDVQTEYKVLDRFKGERLVGLEYEPLYPFLRDSLTKNPSTNQNSVLPLGKGELKGEAEKLKNAFKVYAADFVTTTDGTGIVHTAVMYGTDDFELGNKVGLPKYHLVKEDGTFKDEAGFLAGRFVKDEAVAVDIIKDLVGRGLLFAKEKYAHSYPHCWRCHTPLIYYARDSWYIKMSALRDELVAENQKINWEPSYIKDGRFGEWLKDIKDWAISRERYWGTPLPVWECSGCNKREVIGSFNDLYLRSKSKKITRLILLRHGESEKNVLGLFDSSRDAYPLTKAGEKKAKEAGEKIKKMGGVDIVYASPVRRTRQTAEILGKEIGKEPVLVDALWEVRSGEWDGKNDEETAETPERIAYSTLPHEEFYKAKRGKTGESWQEVENRMAGFVKEMLQKHQGETVVIVSHEGPLMTLLRYLKELSLDEITNLWEERRTFHRGLLGGYAEPANVYVDTRTEREIDPHRPFIDEFSLACDCGSTPTTSSGQGSSPQAGEMKRVKEVMDVWFDSGAMPFAQEHYPFKNKEWVEKSGYPADFISEAIDQTRGWFYTLHAIGCLMGQGRAYKNVICLGHILDAQGKKMSKSLGNVVNPHEMIDKYGADALRFWMYSVNQPGEPKNFDEKTVDEMVKKVFNLASNVLAFYQLYASSLQTTNYKLPTSPHVLDKWILARLNQLIGEVTNGLEAYQLLEPTRAIRDFIADLSQWYLRRSRDRFKGENAEDKQAALATTRQVLITLAELMAPFTPFFAEYVYQEVQGQKTKVKSEESVHLENWPIAGEVDKGLLQQMEEVRKIVSLGLEARAKANIKVRQPLASLKVKIDFLSSSSALGGRGPSLDSRLHGNDIDLIKDEVNVKEIILDFSLSTEVELDTAITPELKEEGKLRELVRSIQELRKEMKLEPADRVKLEVVAEGEARIFMEKNTEALTKQTNLSEIVFVSTLETEEFTLDEMRLKMRIVV